MIQAASVAEATRATALKLKNDRGARDLNAALLGDSFHAGFSRASIDDATQPATAFPYPSNSPICQ